MWYLQKLSRYCIKDSDPTNYINTKSQEKTFLYYIQQESKTKYLKHHHIFAEENKNIFPQTIILTVVDLKNIFLSVSLDQEAALRIKKGMKAEATFEFFRNEKLVGNVESIYSKKDQFIAKVRFPIKIQENTLLPLDQVKILNDNQ